MFDESLVHEIVSGKDADCGLGELSVGLLFRGGHGSLLLERQSSSAFGRDFASGKESWLTPLLFLQRLPVLLPTDPAVPTSASDIRSHSTAAVVAVVAVAAVVVVVVVAVAVVAVVAVVAAVAVAVVAVAVAVVAVAAAASDSPPFSTQCGFQTAAVGGSMSGNSMMQLEVHTMSPERIISLT